MGRPLEDLTGQRFGLLTVIERGPSLQNGKVTTWICACDCGNKRTVQKGDLRRGTRRSCGCAKSAHISEAKTIHGLTRTPEYQAWCDMRARCGNPRHPAFKDYGGRGILVCARWQESFANFYRDMGRRPSADHSIERARVNEGYHPDNCYWATWDQQAQTRRNTRHFTIAGKSLTVAEWARETGVPVKIINQRLRAKWPIERAISNDASDVGAHCVGLQGRDRHARLQLGSGLQNGPGEKHRDGAGQLADPPG